VARSGYARVNVLNTGGYHPAMERRRISSGSPFEREIGFSRAFVVGGHVHVSGTAPVPPPGEPVAPGSYEQTRRCLEIVLAALREAGAGPEHVVRTRTYLTDAGDWREVGRAHGEVFGEVRPASTMVVVAALLDPAWRVEIEVDAILDD
jgi:enamine deaminase RidA (YjgF/YER057c/UK114 family)